MFGGDDGGHRLGARDRMLMQRRREEKKQEELIKFNASMVAMKTANERDGKMHTRLRANTHAQRASEMMFAKMEEESKVTTKRRVRQTRQDDALASEIAMRKMAQQSRDLEVQRICEDDPGLRELEQKLKTAYVTAQRAEQLKVAEAAARASKEADKAIESRMEEDRRLGLREEHAREERRRLNQLEGRRVIEDQMIDKERRKFYEGQQAAKREKAEIDAIISKIAAEDRMDREAITRKRAETQKFIADFKKEQDAWREEARLAAEEEERKIAAYAAEKEAREAGVAARKAAEDAEKDRLYQQIVSQQKALAARLAEEESLRMLLAEEETEMRVAAQAAARDAKRLADRDEMMAANEAQKRLKAELLVKQREEEEEFIRQLRAKYDADEAADRAKADKRDAMKAEYKELVEKQKAERAAMFEMQRQAEIRAEAVAREREEFRRRVVEEARRNLLREHAAKLRAYLPKGVILSKEDMELLDFADTNKDGKLDEEEARRAAAAYRAADADGDGRLTSAERGDFRAGLTRK